MQLFHTKTLNSTIHSLLVKTDNDFIEEAVKAGCLYCGGKLHQADYPRSPHGLSEEDAEHYQFRRSLCCGKCRKRHTPPSVRFFGRRWYVAPVFILINALTGGWSYRRRVQIIKRHFGVTMSKRTWRRWIRWWHKFFEATDFWKQAKGKIHIDYIIGPFPRRLLGMYQVLWIDRFVLLLQFLAPLTAGAFRAV